MYITKEHVVKALTKMQAFHQDIEATFAKHGMPFKENLGRRNIIMSQAQEEFFAQALAETYSDVISDGATGQPDIIIGELNKELECKLASRGKNGQIQFQCDENTMAAKGTLDYLYIVAGPDFEEFAVLHFIDLESNDFFPASPGSKGRARMKKWKAMKKCNVLWGSIDDIRDERLLNVRQKIFNEKMKHTKKLAEFDNKFEVVNPGSSRWQKLEGMLYRNIERHYKKIEKLEAKLQNTLETDSSYRINIQNLHM